MSARRRAGRHPATGAIVVAVVAFVLDVAAGAAQAKSASSLPYPTADVWAAAVRYLRVDRGFPIREKDAQAGYVLFDYADGGKTFHASLELVALTDGDGRTSTEVVITVPDLPQRYEMLLLGELGAKVRQERGPAPPARAKSPPAEPARDAPKSRGEPDGGLPRAPTIPAP